MKILLINHYAGSPQYGMEFRSYYMAREWARQGHAVTIVGANYSHLRSVQPDCNEELIEGVRYIWLDTPAYKGNGFSRVLNMLAFVKGLYCQWPRLIMDNKPELVIASSTYPLDIYPAYYIARKCGARLVYEVHDLWPLSPMELGGMSKYHPFIAVMQWAENYAYKVVDRVISMLPKAKEHMVEHGLKADKFCYVPNGIAISEWQDEARELPANYLGILRNLKEQGKFIVGYAGGHAISNALGYLVGAAELLQQYEVCFVLIGDGVEKKQLMKLVDNKGLDNVFFLPAVKKNAIPAILEKFDVAYIGWNKMPLYRFGVCPNKLFDYMMAGKPVLHSVDAGNDLVAEAKCGISVAAEDVKAIANAILKLKNMQEEEREALGENGKHYVMTHHDYKVLAANFLEYVVE